MVWWVVLLMQLPQVLDLPVTARNPHTTEADLALGRKLFAARCAGCHGPTGDGGKGANLAVPLLPRATDDRGLYRVIRYGLTDTEMPPANLTPLEIWQIAAFVKTLGRMEVSNAAGNASHGGELLRGKGGCLQCHALGIEGGRIGPSLSEIGSRRSAAYLRQKLMEPSKYIPEQFRLVNLITKQGRHVSGIRLNEDNWSIQIRDMRDVLHSFWKEDVAELKEDRRTPMPSYRERLSGEELNDVVAYLAGLKGNQ